MFNFKKIKEYKKMLDQQQKNLINRLIRQKKTDSVYHIIVTCFS